MFFWLGLLIRVFFVVGCSFFFFGGEVLCNSFDYLLPKDLSTLCSFIWSCNLAVSEDLAKVIFCFQT